MDEKIIEILSGLLRETKADVAATRDLAKAAQDQAKAARETANAAKKQADASWLLAEKYTVEIHNYFRQPFWKRWLG